MCAKRRQYVVHKEGYGKLRLRPRRRQVVRQRQDRMRPVDVKGPLVCRRRQLSMKSSVRIR